jgi:Kef-type K+ transport system membrane component KefB/nucleotide-binding universal stress UspA family protein
VKRTFEPSPGILSATLDLYDGNTMLEHAQQQPILSFALLLAVILIVPVIFERMKLPGLIGLLAAGVIFGPSGLNLLSEKSETMQLLSDIGLVYLMFVAGLEVDINQFNKTKHRSAGFGSLTFIVPMIVGTLVGQMFGFGWNASILIGSLFASHTLLAYPIVSRMGVIGDEAVTVTIGATIFTDIGALLVLAVCIGINAGDFSIFKLMTLLVSLAVYTGVILIGCDRLGKAFFRRTGDEEGNQFLFVLLVLFVSALGAELIGVEKIVGAFLAGLAVNEAVGQSPVKEKIIFVGSVLFIPIFFVDMGLLIEIPAFIKSISSFWLTFTVIIGLIGSKFLAALFAKLIYGYSGQQMLTMWSLSLPQVAATLAATLVGYRAGLLTEDLLNSVIVLMMVTATLGPILTRRFAANLSPTIASETTAEIVGSFPSEPSATTPFTIVVPLSNPNTEQNLVELATLIAKQEAGRVVPLAIARSHMHMDAPELNASVRNAQTLLSTATQFCQQQEVNATPILRIDDDIAQGISRTSREQNASLIIMGWGNQTSLRARLFGNIIDRVLYAAHCSIVMARLLTPPSTIQRILVPIDNLSEQSLAMVRFATTLADINAATITLLHIRDRSAPPNQLTLIRQQLDLMITNGAPNAKSKIEMMMDANPIDAIARVAQDYDLVIIRSRRQRTSAGGLAIGDTTTQLIQRLKGSVVILGEPFA